MFELVEQALRLADALRVAPHHPFAAAWFLGHEPRLLQHSDVLLNRSKRHGIRVCELRDRDLGGESSAHNVAARGVGESPEDAAHVVVGEF